MTENWSGLLQKVENQNEVENFSPCCITEKKCKLMRWEMNVIHDKKIKPKSSGRNFTLQGTLMSRILSIPLKLLMFS